MASYTIHGPDSPLLGMKEVREMLGSVSPERVKEMVQRGRFPKPLPGAGPKSPWRWSAVTIACWLHLAPLMEPGEASPDDGTDGDL